MQHRTAAGTGKRPDSKKGRYDPKDTKKTGARNTEPHPGTRKHSDSEKGRYDPKDTKKTGAHNTEPHPGNLLFCRSAKLFYRKTINIF